jgi:hypothetical protein
MISPLYRHNIATSGAKSIGSSNDLLGPDLNPYGASPSALGATIVGVGGAGPASRVVARYKETH